MPAGAASSSLVTPWLTGVGAMSWKPTRVRLLLDLGRVMAGDEVKAALVFDFLQEAVVDDGAVPDEDNRSALWGAAAQGVEGGAFHDADVVLLKKRLIE